MRTAAKPTRRWLPRIVLGGALAGVLAVVIVGSGIAAATAPPVNTAPPKISGVAKVGQILIGDRGSWNGATAPYTYAWLRCNTNGNGCNEISGATGTQYQLTGADDGHRIRFRVTAHGDGATTKQSAATATVVAAGKPANTAAPGISGTPQEGSTLTGSNGTWTNQPTKFTYAWLRCDNKGASCATINGATKNTYVVSSGDVNNTIRFRVTASNSAGDDTAQSGPTAVIGKARGPGCPAGSGNPDQVANINAPARLLVNGLQASPSPVVKGTQTLTVRFHVSSTCGGNVQNALVYTTATPFNQWSVPPEASSGADGWATLTFTRLRGFPVSSKQQLIALFVRARKGGEDPLAGISTRRLVSVRVNLRG